MGENIFKWCDQQGVNIQHINTHTHTHTHTHTPYHKSPVICSTLMMRMPLTSPSHLHSLGSPGQSTALPIEAQCESSSLLPDRCYLREDLKPPTCQGSEKSGTQVSSWVHGTATVHSQRGRNDNNQEANDNGL